MITLLLAIALNSQPAPVRVDVVEINTYERDGEIVLRQALLRRWLRLANGSSHYVEEWRVITSEPQTRKRGNSVSVTITTSDGMHTLQTRSLRETTTDHDPELREREIYSPEQRRAYLQAVSNE
jgi:hypothetical protein